MHICYRKLAFSLIQKTRSVIARQFSTIAREWWCRLSHLPHGSTLLRLGMCVDYFRPGICLTHFTCANQRLLTLQHLLSHFSSTKTPDTLKYLQNFINRGITQPAVSPNCDQNASVPSWIISCGKFSCNVCVFWLYTIFQEHTSCPCPLPHPLLGKSIVYKMEQSS